MEGLRVSPSACEYYIVSCWDIISQVCTTSPRLECILRCAGSSDSSAGTGVPGVAMLLLLS